MGLGPWAQSELHREIANSVRSAERARFRRLLNRESAALYALKCRRRLTAGDIEDALGRIHAGISPRRRRAARGVKTGPL